MERPNTTYLDQLSGGDDAFKMNIITIIKTELPVEVAMYKKNLQKNNFLLTAECVHKLKHKISVLGLKKSYYIAEQFEDNLKKGSTALQNEFEKIVAIMQVFVDGL